MRRTAVRLSVLPPTLRTILSTAQTQITPTSSASSLSTSDIKNQEISVNGWIKSIRTHKNVSFIELNDGSSGRSLQAVLKGKGKAEGLTNGTSVKLVGELKKSRGQGQDFELLVNDIDVLGECDSEAYPIQKKSLPPSVLRDNAHLRFRTSQTAAVMRIRDSLMRDWHDWFEENDFTHIHTPILTGSDCEGAGEVFTLLDRPKPGSSSTSSAPTTTSGPTETSNTNNGTFFPHPVHLTVSSQLHLESPTHSLSRTYTLSPSFRAEPSLTSRHLSEFYMLEGELGFIETLDELLDVVEDGIKFNVDRILKLDSKRGNRIREDLGIIARSLAGSETPTNDSSPSPQAQEGGEVQDLAKSSIINPSDPLNHLRQILSKPFTRITYTQAIKLLNESYENNKDEGELTISGITQWGQGISTENEKWLSNHFGGPAFVTQYPKALKPFYMLPSSSSKNALGEDGKETVECFDLLFPQIGELIGGSLREHRLPNLLEAIEDNNMKKEDYTWYLDLRKFGSIKHGGWGMGFERWISFVTGIQNIKDVVAYPRWKGHCKY